jgi:hypothetical protein
MEGMREHTLEVDLFVGGNAMSTAALGELEDALDK